jgi:hypothetical protein
MLLARLAAAGTATSFVSRKRTRKINVDPTGFEPVTSSMSRKHSNQLSYGSIEQAQ